MKYIFCKVVLFFIAVGSLNLLADEASSNTDSFFGVKFEEKMDGANWTKKEVVSYGKKGFCRAYSRAARQKFLEYSPFYEVMATFKTGLACSVVLSAEIPYDSDGKGAFPLVARRKAIELVENTRKVIERKYGLEGSGFVSKRASDGFVSGAQKVTYTTKDRKLFIAIEFVEDNQISMARVLLRAIHKGLEYQSVRESEEPFDVKAAADIL